MMFGVNEKMNGEKAVRAMSEKAKRYYAGLGQGKVYMDEDGMIFWNAEDGTPASVWQNKAMTVSELEAEFESLQDELDSMEEDDD